MASVRRVRVAPPTHHDSTESRSVTVHVGRRECKQLPAPGENPEEVLSDRGSTPLGSTIAKKTPERVSFLFWQRRVGGDNLLKLNQLRVKLPAVLPFTANEKNVPLDMAAK